MAMYLLECGGRPTSEMIGDDDKNPSYRRRTASRLLLFKVSVCRDLVQLEPGADLTH